jgi:hypothetical protein
MCLITGRVLGPPRTGRLGGGGPANEPVRWLIHCPHRFVASSGGLRITRPTFTSNNGLTLAVRVQRLASRLLGVVLEDHLPCLAYRAIECPFLIYPRSSHAWLTRPPFIADAFSSAAGRKAPPIARTKEHRLAPARHGEKSCRGTSN